MPNLKRTLNLVLAAAFMLAMAAFSASAQTLSNTECLGCHQDPTMTKDVNGKAVPINVDPNKFAASVH